MTEWKPGQRVVVNGTFDGEKFVNEAGEIVEAPPYMERHFLVRFDSIRDVFHNGRGSREADENRHWYFTKGHEGYTFTPEARSTYLNGHADQISGPSVDTSGKSLPLGTSPSTKETTMDDNDRPRFMTAWMADTDNLFHPTGDAFKTLEDAGSFAQEVLSREGREGQIAVLEIRSVHLARLQITSEAA